MSFIGQKLKEARNLLKKTQSEAASEAGILQKEISKLESGTRVFIPNEYILYLHKNGIDINSIIDENRKVVFLCEIKSDDKSVSEALKMISDLSAKCALLEREVEELKRERKTFKAHYGHTAAEPLPELKKAKK